jgi:transmembrane sensor
MTRSEFNDLLKRYRNDRCTPAEREFVESWLNAIEKDAADVSDINVHSISASEMWQGVEKRIADKAHKSISWPLAKVAASVAVLALSLFLVFTYVKPGGLLPQTASADGDLVTYTNSEKAEQTIGLSDGSFVRVGPASEIRYPKVFSGATREVYLSGEAFFDIAKDPQHPFLVYANEVTTRVLGTSFTIRAHKEQKEVIVTVKTGRVSVFSGPSTQQAGAEVILTPNQQVVYNREEGKVTRKLVENPGIIAPVPSMELTYSNEPVSKVFEALERMYGIDIQYDEKALSGCTITTEMTDEGLFERMELICHVLSARYRVEDTIIVVEAKGCSN